MRHAFYLLLSVTLLTSACSGARLSSNEARKKIAAIGTSPLVPQAVEVRRIVSQSDDQAIVEATVTLAFQFKRDKSNGEWRIEAVRLGDRDWMSLDELLAAVKEGRRRATLNSMQKLATGITNYRQQNGTFPNAADIVKLTDMLHPRYMPDLIRDDAWGHPIQYESTGSDFRLRSYGPDGAPNTSDDILVTN